jgi:hypothetical protein
MPFITLVKGYDSLWLTVWFIGLRLPFEYERHFLEIFGSWDYKLLTLVIPG